MRSLGSVRFPARRAVQVAGAATVAVIALAGCSAGQTAETSLLQSPVSGLNTASPDGGLLIRDLQVDDAVRAIHDAFGLGGDEEAVVYAGSGR